MKLSGQEPEKYNNKFLESSNKKESCETLALPRSLPESLLYLQPGSHPGVRWDNPVDIQKVNLALLGSTHYLPEVRSFLDEMGNPSKGNFPHWFRIATYHLQPRPSVRSKQNLNVDQ